MLSHQTHGSTIFTDGSSVLQIVGVIVVGTIVFPLYLTKRIQNYFEGKPTRSGGSSILIFPILPGIENSDEMNSQFSVHLTDGVNNLFATRNMIVDGLVDRVLSAATERFFNLIRSDLLNSVALCNKATGFPR